MSIAYHAPFAVIGGNALRDIRLFMIDEPVDTARARKQLQDYQTILIRASISTIEAIMDFEQRL